MDKILDYLNSKGIMITAKMIVGTGWYPYHREMELNI